MAGHQLSRGHPLVEHQDAFRSRRAPRSKPRPSRYPSAHRGKSLAVSAGLLKPPKKPLVGRPAVSRPPGLSSPRGPGESHVSEETVEPLEPQIELRVCQRRTLRCVVAPRSQSTTKRPTSAHPKELVSMARARITVPKNRSTHSDPASNSLESTSALPRHESQLRRTDQHVSLELPHSRGVTQPRSSIIRSSEEPLLMPSQSVETPADSVADSHRTSRHSEEYLSTRLKPTQSPNRLVSKQHFRGVSFPYDV